MRDSRYQLLYWVASQKNGYIQGVSLGDCPLYEYFDWVVFYQERQVRLKQAAQPKPE